jgi:hypothetical protein
MVYFYFEELFYEGGTCSFIEHGSFEKDRLNSSLSRIYILLKQMQEILDGVTFLKPTLLNRALLKYRKNHYHLDKEE